MLTHAQSSSTRCPTRGTAWMCDEGRMQSAISEIYSDTDMCGYMYQQHALLTCGFARGRRVMIPRSIHGCAWCGCARLPARARACSNCESTRSACTWWGSRGGARRERQTPMRRPQPLAPARTCAPSANTPGTRLSAACCQRCCRPVRSYRCCRPVRSLYEVFLL
jgi:hypothetical protein